MEINSKLYNGSSLSFVKWNKILTFVSLSSVQNRTIEEWFSKVNGCLTNQFKTNTDMTIDWLEKEQLSKYASLSTVEKYWSSPNRKTLKDKIALWHYFINLTT